MSKKSVVAAAALSLASIACAGGQLLSPRANWGRDFTDRSPPTSECPGGSLAQLRTRMAVSAPQELTKVVRDIPEPIGLQVSRSDKLHTFQFSTDPATDAFWGFSGYLVARGDCIVHAEVTGHDN